MNTAAFTTDIAAEAHLQLGKDYEQGDSFIGSDNHTYYTARLLGDPITITIRVIDAIGFVTSLGSSRWVYITLPKFTWDSLTAPHKRDVIGWMYRHEGGTAMIGLFPNYLLP
jgi:hypothetical protein